MWVCVCLCVCVFGYVTVWELVCLSVGVCMWVKVCLGWWVDVCYQCEEVGVAFGFLCVRVLCLCVSLYVCVSLWLSQRVFMGRWAYAPHLLTKSPHGGPGTPHPHWGDLPHISLRWGLIVPFWPFWAFVQNSKISAMRAIFSKSLSFFGYSGKKYYLNWSQKTLLWWWIVFFHESSFIF